jgi:pSer/pThr/pTyr-binding forkhead associated (FHA) protein
MYIRLTWKNPVTQELQMFSGMPPVALGRDRDQMPEMLDGEPVSRIMLEDVQVSRFHALITADRNQIMLTDRSTNGTYHNGEQVHQTSQSLANGDVLHVGLCQLEVMLRSPLPEFNLSEFNLSEPNLSEPNLIAIAED